MDSWFLTHQREFESEEPWAELRSEFEFAEEAAESESVASYSHVRESRFFRKKFEYNVEISNERLWITEKAFLPVKWYFTALISFLGFTLFNLVEFPTSPEMFLVRFSLSIVGLLVFILSISAGFNPSSPVSSLIDRNESGSMFSPLASVLLIVFPISAPRVLLETELTILRFVVVAVVWGAFWNRHDDFIDYSLMWQRGLLGYTTGLPKIVKSYIGALLVGLTPPVAFIFGYNTEWRVVFIEYPWVSLALFAGSMGGYLIFILVFLKSRRVSPDYRFNPVENSSTKRVKRAVLITILSLVSIGYLYLLYKFFHSSLDYLSMVPALPTLGVVIASGAPLMFFGSGFVFQWVSTFQGVLAVRSASEKANLDEVYDTDYPIQEYDSDRLFAGALSSGVGSSIVVSKGLVELLEKGELAAVIAHEEAHLRSKDAVIATWISLLSPFLFLGKNVVFNAINFRGREYRADRYAAQQTNRDQVISALNRINTAERNQLGDTGGGIPTLTGFKINRETTATIGVIREIHGLHFGDCALTQIHPTLQERVNSLKKDTQ